jgi:hypothetical protein
MSQQKSPYVIFQQTDSENSLQLTYKYIPLHISDEISRIVASYKAKEISLEEAYNKGKTFIEANVSEIKATPFSFTLTEDELDMIKRFALTYDTDTKQKMLVENPSLPILIENLILDQKENECTKNLRIYVFKNWERWLKFEILKNGHQNKTWSIFDLFCQELLKRSSRENDTEDTDFQTLKDHVQTQLDQFYVHIAKLEYDNMKKGKPVFSRPSIVRPVVVLKRTDESCKPNKKVKFE